jgi:hypothetical protein
MSGLTSLGVGVPFGWNIPSGFRVISSKAGQVVCQEVLTTPFSGGTSLDDKFSQWGEFPFIFLGNNFGNVFPIGYTSVPRGNPLGEHQF